MKGYSTKACADFLSTDYGLTSAGVVIFTLGMDVFFARFFLKNMREDEARMNDKR